MFHGRFRQSFLTTGIFLVFVLGLAFVLRGTLPVSPGSSKQLSDYKSTAPGRHDSDAKIPGAGPVLGKQHGAPPGQEYTEIISDMTQDGGYFGIDFVDETSFNPNLIPHPSKPDTWIMIAQRDKSRDDNGIWFVEMVCEAVFTDGSFQCTKSPIILPIASTASPLCTDTLSPFNNMIGPHDARVFYGPDVPYIVYGSQSQHHCLGQWIQDLRRIVNWATTPVTNQSQMFFFPTDLQRPPPVGKLEKNWFAFWDSKDEMYLHYDLLPRALAKVAPDGSVGKDLAPLAADTTCMERIMPQIKSPDHEYIHQATNSLAITLCRRADVPHSCQKTEENTFVFTIFHHKSWYGHDVYEPYAMVFNQSAPFAVHGVSSKPFWYEGRGKPGEHWAEGQEWADRIEDDQSEMVFTTSMSWKQHGQTYHGYLDDVLLLAFGLEDRYSAGIDVVAGDLLADLKLCNA